MQQELKDHLSGELRTLRQETDKLELAGWPRLRGTRWVNLAKTNFEFGRMWLGKTLGALQGRGTYPYAESLDPSNRYVAPASDKTGASYEEALAQIFPLNYIDTGVQRAKQIRKLLQGYAAKLVELRAICPPESSELGYGYLTAAECLTKSLFHFEDALMAAGMEVADMLNDGRDGALPLSLKSDPTNGVTTTPGLDPEPSPSLTPTTASSSAIPSPIKKEPGVEPMALPSATLFSSTRMLVGAGSISGISFSEPPTEDIVIEIRLASSLSPEERQFWGLTPLSSSADSSEVKPADNAADSLPATMVSPTTEAGSSVTTSPSPSSTSATPSPTPTATSSGDTATSSETDLAPSPPAPAADLSTYHSSRPLTPAEAYPSSFAPAPSTTEAPTATPLPTSTPTEPSTDSSVVTESAGTSSTTLPAPFTITEPAATTPASASDTAAFSSPESTPLVVGETTTRQLYFSEAASTATTDPNTLAPASTPTSSSENLTDKPADSPATSTSPQSFEYLTLDGVEPLPPVTDTGGEEPTVAATEDVEPTFSSSTDSSPSAAPSEMLSASPSAEVSSASSDDTTTESSSPPTKTRSRKVSEASSKKPAASQPTDLNDQGF